MALLDYALCNVEDILNWTQFNGDPSAVESSVMEDLINAVTMRFEKEVGRQIRARSLEDRLDGTGKMYLYLPQYPVFSIDALQSLYPDGTLFEEYSIDEGDLYVSRVGRLTLQGSNLRPFPRGSENIAITYQPGFETIPDDINVAACQWVTEWFKAWQNKRDPIENITFGGVSAFIRTEPIPVKVKPILDLYRLPASAAA